MERRRCRRRGRQLSSALSTASASDVEVARRISYHRDREFVPRRANDQIFIYLNFQVFSPLIPPSLPFFEAVHCR